MLRALRDLGLGNDQQSYGTGEPLEFTEEH